MSIAVVEGHYLDAMLVGINLISYFLSHTEPGVIIMHRAYCTLHNNYND